ncbi:MAG: two-component regulator propeller domain-containing protein [Bacteroidota bacterium]|nr:two-component regulator propeller domain-containing protein [Bacteroidota bacterium]
MRTLKLILFFLIPFNCFAQYQWTHYTTLNTGDKSPPSNTIFDIFENPATNTLFIKSWDVLSEYSNLTFNARYDIYDPIFINGHYHFYFSADNQGNIWYEAQDTLYKFDGTSISKYPLPSSAYTVTLTFCDSQGNVWIGTASILFRFNGTTFDMFTTASGLAGDFIHAVYEDPQGYIWVGTEYGLSMYNGTSWLSYDAADGLAWSNNSSCIYSIMQDENGTMWVGGREIAYFNGNGWTTLIPATLTSTTNDIKNISPIINDTVNNRLWFGSMDMGVFYRENNNWYRHTTVNGLPTNEVLSGTFDSQGRVWFGLQSGGLCKFEQNTWTYYSTLTGLAENLVNDICESASHEIWAATKNGVSRFDFVNWESYFTKHENHGNPLVKRDYDNQVIVSEYPYIYRYHNGFVDTIYSYNGGLGYDFISESSDDYWTVGNLGALHFWGPDFWNISNWNIYSQGLSNMPCKSVERDSSGTLWVGTTNGVAYMQGNIFIPEVIQNTYLGYRFNDLRNDLNGGLWMATNYGIACKNDTSWEYYFEADGLAHNWVWEIEIASDSTIWFATMGGISVLTDTGFYNITDIDGLVHRHARCLEQDHLGNMWIGTQHGISKLHNAVTVLGKEEIKSQSSLELFPNPAKDKLIISSSSETIPIAGIEIYNLSGQLLQKTTINKKQGTIDVSGLSPGNYFLRAIGKSNVWVKKFVVIR